MLALTLLGEERLLVERLHREGSRVQRLKVAEVAVAGAGVRKVQLRLDADWTLTADHTPLEALSPSSFVLTLEEPQLPRGVLHTLPLLHTQSISSQISAAELY